MEAKFILWEHQENKDGTYPIRLRITKNRKVKYIATGLSGKPEQWDALNECFIRSNKINPVVWGQKVKDGKTEKVEIGGYKFNNSILDDFKARIKEIEANLRFKDWTLDEFKGQFLHKISKDTTTVQQFFMDKIKNLKDTGHVGNAKCYERTLHILTLFDKNFQKRSFNDITKSFIMNWDTWMQKPRVTTYKIKENERKVSRNGCCGNTRKYYHKAFRAVLNEALKVKLMHPDIYPYGKGGFNVATLEEETSKRYLPNDYLGLIKTNIGTTDKTEFARRLFLFSYYTFGMAFMDMALLKKQNIQRMNDGLYIIYKRHKTRNSRKAKPIHIKITDEIKDCLDYFSENEILIENYILPIVSIAGYDGETLYNHIRGRYKKYSIHLSKLAEELCINDVNLTTYVSRHTMAMQLQSNDIPREVISQMLGHTDLKTTNTYLDGFGKEVVNEAAKVL